MVAVFEGSDPVLKNEYVALGAHYDHVGVGVPVNGDAIYNGADDDGSGTTALLAMAEALAKAAHVRSVRCCLSGMPAKKRDCGGRVTSPTIRPFR